METESRFDLEAAISNWRNELANHPGITADNLRELESHLRDAVASSMKSGLDSQAAFEQSLKQIGDTNRIISEHAKENAHLIWRDRFFWMSFAALVWFASPSLFSLLTFLFSKADEIVSNQIPKLVSFFDLEWIHYYLPDWAYSLTRFFSLGGIYLIISALLLVRLSSSRTTTLRAMINWLIARRTRFIAVSILLWLMTWDFLMPYFIVTGKINPENYWFVTWNAGNTASSIVFHLLVFGSAITLHSGIKCRIKSTKLYSDHLRIPQAIWQDRVFWMVVGLLALQVWGLLSGGTANVIWKTIDTLWIRILLGGLLPIALLGFVSLIAKKGKFRITSFARKALQRDPARIFFLAVLFFALQTALNVWISRSQLVAYHTWLMESGQSSVVTYGSAFSLKIALINFYWPAILFGLLIWFQLPSVDKIKRRLIDTLSRNLEKN